MNSEVLADILTTDFCVEALQEAITKYGTPEIFNTDQGSQFTSLEFTQVLQSHGIRISMDGKGRWVDNVFVERLWRSVKYEEGICTPTPRSPKQTGVSGTTSSSTIVSCLTRVSIE